MLPKQPAGKRPLQDVCPGSIINSSILQGHKRKNWKVRKFVLRADPAFLHYYDPTKVCERGVDTPRNPLADLNIIMKIQGNYVVNVPLSQISFWILLLICWGIRPHWPYLWSYLCMTLCPCIPCLPFTHWDSFSLDVGQQLWGYSFAVRTPSVTVLLQGFFLGCSLSGLAFHHLRATLGFPLLFLHPWMGFPWSQSVYRNLCHSDLNLLKE